VSFFFLAGPATHDAAELRQTKGVPECRFFIFERPDCIFQYSHVWAGKNMTTHEEDLPRISNTEPVTKFSILAPGFCGFLMRREL
jgi:hypothetical protein